jgi:hypothetical protein
MILAWQNKLNMIWLNDELYGPTSVIPIDRELIISLGRMSYAQVVRLCSNSPVEKLMAQEQ